MVGGSIPLDCHSFSSSCCLSIPRVFYGRVVQILNSAFEPERRDEEVETRFLSASVLHCALLEKEIATHSGTLAWKIPWMEEPMGSQRVRHD